jgi:2,4-dienoyl-CoA reductase (NADPH2)
MVPRGAYTWVTQRLMGTVKIPLITTNRINTPEKAEAILSEGLADMVSMARPLLADPHFVRKARENRAEDINTCIACNQACLDFIFKGKEASCLVNPRAAHETLFPAFGQPARRPARFAVVGAGPAGLSCATELAAMGHEVDLFEASGAIGGQFNLAKNVPGKAEFHETLRYFRTQIVKTGVRLHLNTHADAVSLQQGNYQAVVVATGAVARLPEIPGIDHARVLRYADVLSGKVEAGRKVAIVGAGGIGFDVAMFLTTPPAHFTQHGAEAAAAYYQEWGIDTDYRARGGVAAPDMEASPREVWLLKRSKGKFGETLGKTTGWAHRITLKNRGVHMLGDVQYQHIGDDGFRILVKGESQLLDVDHVVICAGQEPQRTLYAPLQAAGMEVHLIGGAHTATELDARRAIEEGLLTALRLST